MIRQRIALAGTLAAAVALGACTDRGESAAGLPASVAAGQIADAGEAAVARPGTGASGAPVLRLDARASALQQVLGGTGAGVVDSGAQLIISLPEALTFPADSATLRPEMVPTLVSVARILQSDPGAAVEVVGHGNASGTAAAAQGLSGLRARAVARVLIGGGLAPGRVSPTGRGSAQPIASNASPAGRAANRRVEIVITPGT